MDNNNVNNYGEESIQKTAQFTEKLIYYAVFTIAVIYNLPFSTSFHKLALINTILGIFIILSVFIWNNIIKIKNLRIRIYIEQILITIVIFTEMGIFEGGNNPIVLAFPIVIIIAVMSITKFRQVAIYTTLLFIGYFTILIIYFNHGFNQRFELSTELWSTIFVILAIYTYLKLYRNINEEYIKEVDFRKQEEKLNIEKDSFAKIIESHLSSPIESIDNQINQIIKSKIKDSKFKEIKDTFDKIQINANILKRLSENILSLEILNLKDLTFNLEKIDIAKLTEDTINTMNIKAQEKNISISYDKKNPIYINVDIERMGEILRNIIDNAIKYTPNGGGIIINIENKKNKIYINIKDNGIGIPKKDLSHLFEKFYRASNVEKNTNQGYGIGLYLINQYVKKMNGKIDIHSTEGKGSTFSLIFSKYV